MLINVRYNYYNILTDKVLDLLIINYLTVGITVHMYQL